MKTPEQILEMAKMIQSKARDAFDKAESKLARINSKAKRKSKNIGGYSTWSTWNLTDLIRTEKTKANWDAVVNGLEVLVKEGKTSEQIVDYIRGYRDSVISETVRHRTLRSTNPMSNLVDGIEQDALKELAGSSSIDGDSLAALILNAGGNRFRL